MTPSEKKKRRQVVLLVVLSAVLLAVVYWQYLLSPTLTACDDLDEKISDNETRLADMQSEIIAIPGYERDTEDVITRIGESTAELYPIMNTEDADIMLLKSMNSSGLSASALSVSASPAGENDGDGESTGVYIITAVYEAAGSYSSLLNFIARVNGMPAVVISSITSNSAASEDKTYTPGAGGARTDVNNTPASEESMTFELTAQVFMYEAPEIPEHFDEPPSQTLEVEVDAGLDDLL